MGAIFIFSLLAFICLAALVYPHIGVIGYIGFVLLMPEWNWRWSLPPDFQYQKFIAIATLIGFALTGFKGNPFRGRELTACACLVGFLGLAYVSAMFTINESATAFYMQNLWKIVLMSVLTYRLLDTPGKIVACMWVMVLAQGYNAFRINEQYFQDGYSLYALRPWGDKGDNNLYSNVTVPLIAMSGALVVYSRRFWQKGLAGGIMLLQMHQIMLLESRGAMLGCLLLGALFVYLMPKNTFTISALVLALAVGAVLAGPPVVQEFTSAFKGEGERDSSAESRLTLWRAGAKITADHPLLGVGPYAGQYLVPHYGGLGGGQKGLHNLLFEISTGCGVPATSLYLLYYLIPILIGFQLLRYRGFQPPEWASAVAVTATPGLTGYWLANMFSSGALLEASYSVAALGLAMAAILRHMPLEELDEPEEDGEWDDEANYDPHDNNLMSYAE